LRGLVESDAEPLPKLVSGVDVFGEEADLRLATDEAEFFGAGFGSDEREDGLTVGRRNGDPTAVVGEIDIGENAEAKPVDVEVEASLVIANVDGGFEDAEVRTLRALGAVGAR
jgi:hypothetical protein